MPPILQNGQAAPTEKPKKEKNPANAVKTLTTIGSVLDLVGRIVEPGLNLGAPLHILAAQKNAEASRGQLMDFLKTNVPGGESILNAGGSFSNAGGFSGLMSSLFANNSSIPTVDPKTGGLTDTQTTDPLKTINSILDIQQKQYKLDHPDPSFKEKADYTAGIRQKQLDQSNKNITDRQDITFVRNEQDKLQKDTADIKNGLYRVNDLLSKVDTSKWPDTSTAIIGSTKLGRALLERSDPDSKKSLEVADQLNTIKELGKNLITNITAQSGKQFSDKERSFIEGTLAEPTDTPEAAKKFLIDQKKGLTYAKMAVVYDRSLGIQSDELRQEFLKKNGMGPVEVGSYLKWKQLLDNGIDPESHPDGLKVYKNLNLLPTSGSKEKK